MEFGNRRYRTAAALMRKGLRSAVAAVAGLTMALTMVPLAGQTAVAAEPTFTDDGTVQTYAATGAGADVLGNATKTPDVASDKYQVTVNGTPVEAVQYTAKGHNFDIARFASSSRTPVVKVKMINGEKISKVNIYPERYYEGKYQVSDDQTELTFQMEKSLISAMVMVNSGDKVNAKGQPYLALINDIPESERNEVPSKAEGSSADEKAWGYNESTGVLNFQTFAKKYLTSEAGATLPDGKTKVQKQEPIASHHTSLYNDGKGTQVGGQTAKGVTSEGRIIYGKDKDGNVVTDPAKASTVVSGSETVTQVGYPDQRAMSADDSTYALQAAFDFIENNASTLNTLYFPNGTYTYGGMDVNGVDGSKLKGGHLTIYTEEGALLKNHVQPYREAQEPAIGVWNSKSIVFDGRGIYDGNGAKNYSDKNGNTSGDKNDAYNSQHQAGVMVVQSSDITFNDTYMRGAKQWNWETHTAKDSTFNNIKGLTPYEMSWGDGMDFASGQNLTVNGAVTFGNDDTFASGHYNPGRWFQADKPDLYNKMFGFNGSNPNIQGYDNAVGGYEAFVDSHGIDNDAWDTADSHDITLNNTLGWSFAGGNGIRLGHEAHGYQMKNYTFNNFNSLGFQGGGNAITVQNNTDIYPRYENIQVLNSSFDTSRVGTNFSVQGGQGNTQTVTAANQKDNGYRPNPDGSGNDYTITRTPIAKVTIDNTWFSNANAGFSMNNVTDATVNDLYVGGKQVQYTNQANFTKSDSVKALAYTYTDADGKTQPVKQNSLPTFTAPTAGTLTATAGKELSFDVKVDDPDVANGDNVKLSVSDLSGLDGARFDASTGKFTWTPTEEQSGKNYSVTFTAADEGAQAGDYDAVTKSVRIRVVSAKSEIKSVTSSADAYVASWKGNKTQDYSANPGGKNTAGYFAVRNTTGKGLLGERNTSTNTGDGTDVKLGFVQFDLAKFKGTSPSAAQLKLTLIGRRYDTANRADEQIAVSPVEATKRLDGTDFDGSLAGMTWNTRPDFTATEEGTTESAAFDNGNAEVRNDVPGSVAGTTVTVDVTKAVQDAVKAGKSTLLLAVGGKFANDELYFVNTKGAAEGIYGAKADQAPTLDVTLPISGGQTSDVLANFTFDDLKDGATGYVDAASSAATAEIEGSAATATNDENKTTAAKIGNGFWLNVTKADGTPLLAGVNDLTVSFDAKPDSGNPGWAFYAAPNTNAPQYNKSEHYLGVMAKPGSVSVERYNTEGNRDTRGNASGTAPASGWYNVTVTVSDEFTRVYVDGVLAQESKDVKGLDLPSILGESGGILQVGKANWGSGEYFTGMLDNMKIYNRVLSDEEIAKANNAAAITAATVGTVPTDPDSLQGTDDHSATRTTVDKDTKTITSVVNRRGDAKALPVTLKAAYSDATFTVDGQPFKSGDKLDLTRDRKLTVTYATSDGTASDEWTIKAATVGSNPVLPGQYADPDIDYFDGRFWIFPTTDGFSGWSGNYFHAFSSTDLQTWKDEGVILDVNKDHAGQKQSYWTDQTTVSPWSVGSAWAPTIEKKNGKYYFYYCAKYPNGQSAIGVAVADNPAGPYKAADQPVVTRTMEGVTVNQAIDPSIFTDPTTGKSYITYGNGTPAIAELNDDMVSVKSGTVRTIKGLTDFRESVVVTYRDGKYHWTWTCDDAGSPNYHVNYGVSDSLDGDIAFKGTLLQQDASKQLQGTAHQSDVHVIDTNGNDRWFMAYHRHYTPLGIFHSPSLGYHRETAIGEIHFGADGLMQTIKPTDEGVGAVAMADTTALDAAIDAAGKVANDGYTEESWKAFEDALAAAKTAKQTFLDHGIAQKDVDSAAAALTKAQQGLTKPAAPTVTGIEVATPVKTVYEVGETYDGTGLAVTKVFSDGSKAAAETGEYTVSAADAEGKTVDLTKPFAESSIGKVTVTVSLTGTEFTGTFDLTVTQKPDTTAPVFSGVDDVTIDYGSAFDPLAGVTATDDRDGDVTKSFKVSGSVDTEQAGTYTLTYTVADNAGNEAKATRTVTVREKPAPTVVGIKVTKPKKTAYIAGDTYDPAGFAVSKVMSDASVTEAKPTEYGVLAVAPSGAPVDLTKPFPEVGDVTLTVTLNGTDFSDTFTVSVAEADKTALNRAIAEAEKLDKADYKSGWDAFQSALADAKTVSADKDSWQSTVDDALAALKTAQGKLVPVEQPQPNKPGNGGNGQPGSDQPGQNSGSQPGSGNGQAGNASQSGNGQSGLSKTGVSVTAFAVAGMLLLAAGAIAVMLRRNRD
ncbi:family 43 glycosylhydrolase [Bifidobacterium leontopitheci]|uniref:Glycosyl hydrolase family 43 n=1 Tax=Bifidobacterium leontopitheci TaxID=2650774 RepID=A0A6I1GFG1_9BIFI|nr:family 43 glycosylhydrolase [Bifidobacterium leontopitheci]KAB7790354.1 glycosyl hydrolase family 43 [Bifidobacterium leontopitheci]